MDNVSFLIVEDHELHRETLLRTLNLLGAKSLLSATNGAQAIRAVRAARSKVQVVITDLMMPDVDGIELITILQRDFPEVALVLVSADEVILDMAAAIAEEHGLHVLGTLRKPIDANKLRTLLDRYLPPFTRNEAE